MEPPYSTDGCCYRENRHTDRSSGRRPRDNVGTAVMQLQAQEYQGWLATLGTWEEARKHSSVDSSEREHGPDGLDLTLELQNWEE